LYEQSIEHVFAGGDTLSRINDRHQCFATRHSPGATAMKMKQTLSCWIAAFVTMLCFSPLYAAEPSGQMLAVACAGCHGTQGKSQSTIPGLSHLTAQQLIKAMKAFKSGERPSTLMGRIAKGYSDAEIESMAEYLAGK
jgi:sulfide dehydrogenase cytochrome subunit